MSCSEVIFMYKTAILMFLMFQNNLKCMNYNMEMSWNAHTISDFQTIGASEIIDGADVLESLLSCTVNAEPKCAASAPGHRVWHNGISFSILAFFCLNLCEAE